jgi:hypothetical protein
MQEKQKKTLTNNVYKALDYRLSNRFKIYRNYIIQQIRELSDINKQFGINEIDWLIQKIEKELENAMQSINLK